MASMLRLSAAVGFVSLVSLASIACAPPEDDVAVDDTTQALETFPNEQPAFEYFVGKGLTEAQSAGIVGNLDAESGVDPTIKQSGGGPGRGIAQWSAGARWDTTNGDNVLDYAAEQGMSATSLQLQLDFIWFELTNFTAYGLTHLQAAGSVSTAAGAFAKYFEGCAACNSSLRVQYGESVLARFGGGNGGTSSSSSSGEPAEPCTIDTTGEIGECITTSACAALGNSVSTPGYCPGADDVQCCTSVDPGPITSSSGGASNGGTSSGGTGPGLGTSSGSSTGTSGSSGRDGADGTDSEGGCSTSGAPLSSGGLVWSIAGLLWVASRRTSARR